MAVLNDNNHPSEDKEKRLSRLLSESLLAYLSSDSKRKKDHDQIFILIREGANVNCQNTLGATPLMHIASFGDVKLAKKFLLIGADPDMTDHKGRRAVDYATRSGFDSMVVFLKNAKAFLLEKEKEDFQNKMNDTPIGQSQKPLPRKTFKGFKKKPNGGHHG